MPEELTFTRDDADAMSELRTEYKHIKEALDAVLAKLDSLSRTMIEGREEHTKRIQALEASDQSAKVTEALRRIASLEHIVAGGRGAWMVAGVVGGILTIVAVLASAWGAVFGPIKGPHSP